jgi:hypothetical protein
MPKHPGGRPSEYSEEILTKAKEYLDSCEDETEKVVEMANEEKGYEKYRNKLKVNLPSVAGLAIYLEVARSTVYEWGEQHKEFSDILEKILAEQEKRLIENGLSGDYNPQIAKLVLGKHGYHDKQDVDQKVSGSLSLTDLFNKAKE